MGLVDVLGAAIIGFRRLHAMKFDRYGVIKDQKTDGRQIDEKETD